MTYLFSPLMATGSTARLTEEHIKVCSSLLAAGPKLKTLMEDWNTRMVCAHGFITVRSFIGYTATSILASSANCYFTVSYTKL